MLPNLIPLYLYQGRPLPQPQHFYDYLLAEQGLIKRLETNFVSADQMLVPIASRLTGLQVRPYPLSGLRLKVPRVPGRLLAELYRYAGDHLDEEVMVQLKYRSERGWWLKPVELTQQSSVHLRYLADPQDTVVEIHSHHRMEAFFSATDDADEQGGHVYGVIGRLDTPRPELALRLGLFGTWLFNIPGLTLFDDLGPFVNKWLDAPTPPPTHTPWYQKLFSWR